MINDYNYIIIYFNYNFFYLYIALLICMKITIISTLYYTKSMKDGDS